VRFIVKRLYRLAFRYPYHIFFLNSEDRDLFIEEKMVKAHQTSLIPGAGVDVQRYRPMPKAKGKGRIVFLLLSRLIWEKGIKEYMHIADTLSQKYDYLRFQLLGFPVNRSRDGLTTEFIDTTLADSTVEYLGATDDVVPYIRDADCVVLPTRYREGIPRSLLEAASMGKPIIASDNVGCREIIEHGKNGFLFKNTIEEFIQAVERFIRLSEQERAEMGRKGREKILREFDINRVVDRYVEVIESLL
jgi:glycosyltransferase involved in cell wall biosynthesis